MLKISDAIKEIIISNNYLNYGLSHGLLNISQTAEWIKPLIELRTKKKISKSAVLMALSRMMKQKKRIIPELENFRIQNLNVYSRLCELTYTNSPEIRKKLDKLYAVVQQNKGYITVTQGINEVTVIFNMDFIKNFEETIVQKPKFKKENLTALGMQFDPTYVLYPGMTYHLIEQITLQNINVWEFSSTYTEIIFYIDQKDLKLAFDTIYDRFC